MTRRLLSLATALCLLAGIPMIPAAPALVCRMTGKPMTPMFAPKDASERCCGVRASLAADGTLGFALTDPGCCDLRVIPGRPDLPPAAQTPAAEAPVAALTTLPPVAPIPPLTEPLTVRAPRAEAAPRAPPLRTASPRAPPFVS